MNKNKNILKHITKKSAALIMAGMLVVGGGAYGYNTLAASVTENAASTSYSSSTAGENAVLVDGKTITLSDVTVTKSGNGSGENSDFYGTNAAVLAKNGANLTLKNSSVSTSGSYANGVFSYGSGTTVDVSDTTITTTSNNSGGIMTTGGASMNASNLTVNTSGNSSAAIRSDRGGGNVCVSGGTYKTTGVGSPAIYSTAAIKVSGATLSSAVSEAVVVEGGNSVTLNNCNVTASNTVKNGQSTTYQNVMLYQSMSGDASSGTSSFTMNGGSMTANNGAMFYVTNTTSTINLSGASLSTASGQLFNLAAGAWGSSGSNGGHATVNASGQALSGSTTVDSSSSLNLVLSSGSTYSGSINSSGQTGNVYVEVPEGCTWTLNDDSYITSLTCSASSINTNGHTLYVNGTAYETGTESNGESVSSGSQSTDTPSGDMPAPNGTEGNDAPDANTQPGGMAPQTGVPVNISDNVRSQKVMEIAPYIDRAIALGIISSNSGIAQTERKDIAMVSIGEAPSADECTFTIGEIITVACIFHNAYNGGSIDDYKSADYATCQSYALAHGLIKASYSNLNGRFSVQEAVAILNAAVPSGSLNSIIEWNEQCEEQTNEQSDGQAQATTEQQQSANTAQASAPDNQSMQQPGSSNAPNQPQGNMDGTPFFGRR